MESKRMVGMLAIVLAIFAMAINFMAIPIILSKLNAIQTKVINGMADFKTLSDQAWLEILLLHDHSPHNRGKRQAEFNFAGVPFPFGYDPSANQPPGYGAPGSLNTQPLSNRRPGPPEPIAPPRILPPLPTATHLPMQFVTQVWHRPGLFSYSDERSHGARIDFRPPLRPRLRTPSLVVPAPTDAPTTAAATTPVEYETYYEYETTTEPYETDPPQVEIKPCPPGPPGPPGIPGRNGKAGRDGPEGLPGRDPVLDIFNEEEDCHICPAGPEGPLGSAGTRGPKGDKGEHGHTGLAGVDGWKGNPGSRGLPGQKGVPGKNGTVGAPGADTQGGHGPPGPKGAKGPIGRSGVQGLKGKRNPVYGSRGTRGKPGLPGRDGIPGTNGRTGPRGPKGHKGANANYCPCPLEMSFIKRSDTSKPELQSSTESSADAVILNREFVDDRNFDVPPNSLENHDSSRERDFFTDPRRSYRFQHDRNQNQQFLGDPSIDNQNILPAAEVPQSSREGQQRHLVPTMQNRYPIYGHRYQYKTILDQKSAVPKEKLRPQRPKTVGSRFMINLGVSRRGDRVGIFGGRREP